MKNKYLYLMLVSTLVFVFSCSDMNDTHKAYLGDGERIYIGKIDSLKAFPGDERIKLRFWASDPRAKAVVFYWIPGNDSLVYEMTKTSPTDSFEVWIGGKNSSRTITEGIYTLRILTTDNKNNYSLPYEEIVSIYGDKFRANLINRTVTVSQYNSDDKILTIELSDALNDKDIGVEVKYTDQEGQQMIVRSINPEADLSVTLSNVDPSKEVAYRTLYLPSPAAIDTFYTAYAPVEAI